MATIKPKFFGKMQAGKLLFYDREQFDHYLEKFPDETEMELTIARKYKRRTAGLPGEATNFNGYWWAVVIRLIADEMGELDDDYTHNLVQVEIGNVRRTTDGQSIPAGTKHLSGGEFADLCARARIWASKELSLSIPEPNEAEYGY